MIWPDDPQSVDLLQEWFGYCLTADTRLQKILLIVGPKRSGKGTIGRVLTKLIGLANVVNPTLAGLATQFGLQPLIGKLLAIISDARLSGRTDIGVVTERLLSVSGEDSQTIDMKHKPAWTGRLPTRLMLMSNELPRLGDASGALSSRMIILQMRQSFYGKEDPGLTDRLLGELPGILLWAVEGWKRLNARGHFKTPESSRQMADDLDDISSPVGAFVRECCCIAPEARIARPTLYKAFTAWAEEQGQQHVPSAAVFGRDLVAAVPSVSSGQRRCEGGRERFYEGITLA